MGKEITGYSSENSREGYEVEIEEGVTIEVRRVEGKWEYPVFDDYGNLLRIEKKRTYRPEELISDAPGNHPTFYQVSKQCGGLSEGRNRFIPAGHIWRTNRLSKYK